MATAWSSYPMPTASERIRRERERRAYDRPSFIRRVVTMIRSKSY